MFYDCRVCAGIAQTVCQEFKKDSVKRHSKQRDDEKCLYVVLFIPNKNIKKELQQERSKVAYDVGKAK